MRLLLALTAGLLAFCTQAQAAENPTKVLTDSAANLSTAQLESQLGGLGQSKKGGRPGAWN